MNSFASTAPLDGSTLDRDPFLFERDNTLSFTDSTSDNVEEIVCCPALPGTLTFDASDVGPPPTPNPVEKVPLPCAFNLDHRMYHPTMLSNDGQAIGGKVYSLCTGLPVRRYHWPPQNDRAMEVMRRRSIHDRNTLSRRDDDVDREEEETGTMTFDASKTPNPVEKAYLPSMLTNNGQAVGGKVHCLGTGCLVHMYDWPVQSDPATEKKRVRSVRERNTRVRMDNTTRVFQQ